MISDHAKNLLARIDEGQIIINQNRPLPRSILHKLREQLIIDWTYNSNAIEGNTLSLNETKLILEDGLTIGRKSLKEHLETINHREAIEFVEHLSSSKKNKLTERNVREIHSLVMKGIDPDYAGQYRDIQVRISGSSHVPPEPILVASLMKKMMKGINKDEHPIVQAAKAHFELVSIHPFVDGNGRTARLLMNLILMRNGYTPGIILKNDRKRYYDILEKTHRGELNDFIVLVGRAVERTIHLYFEAIPGLSPKLLTLVEAAEISPYSKEYLNVMARRGVIPALKIRRNWMVSKAALQEYIKSHKK